MVRRITCWSSCGFIHLLAAIPDDVVKNAFTPPTAQITRRKDMGLADTFVSSENIELIRDVMAAHPTAGTKYPDHLAASLRQLVQAENVDEVESTLYSKDTCIEFHHFLVALLCYYHKKSVELSDAMVPSKGQSIRLAAMRFWNAGNLLWKVAHSQILHNHLNALQAAGSLHVPTKSNKTIYKSFLKGKGEDGGDGGKTVGEGEGKKGNNSSDEGEGSVEDDETDDIEMARRFAEREETRPSQSSPPSQ